MSLDGAGKVIDPRSETTRMYVLQHRGFLRPSAGPWVDTIGQTAPLTRKLQRLPNVFNPLPHVTQTKMAVKQARKKHAEVRRKGAKFLRGRGIRHAAARTIVDKSRKAVANAKRHVHEV